MESKKILEHYDFGILLYVVMCTLLFVDKI